jgi:chemotaxis protein histidine kinase CheA
MDHTGIAWTEIVKEFLMESHENLDRLDQDLVALEKDPHSQETLASIFRTMHSLKGTSGFLGFDRLEAVGHAGENLLSRLRDGELTPVSRATEKPAAPLAAAAAGPRAPVALDSTIRVDVRLLDKFMNLVGELVLVRNQFLQSAGQSKDGALLATSRFSQVGRLYQAV